MNVDEVQALREALDAAIQSRDYLWENRKKLRESIGDDFGTRYAAVEHAVFVAAEAYRDQQDQDLETTLANIRAKTTAVNDELENLKTATQIVGAAAALASAAVALSEAISPL